MNKFLTALTLSVAILGAAPLTVNSPLNKKFEKNLTEVGKLYYG